MLESEKAMAPHSSTLAWKIPWMEEPGRLQSMVSLRVGHDWVTSLSLFTFMHREGNGNPFQCSCLENPGDGKSWWAAVYGVAQSWARLKWLSSKTLQRFKYLSHLIVSSWMHGVFFCLFFFFHFSVSWIPSNLKLLKLLSGSREEGGSRWWRSRT